MRKTIAIMLSVVMLFSLTACKKECEHEYSSTVTKKATCAKRGVKTYTCKKCGDSYTEGIPKNDKHEYTSEVTKEATAKECGIITYTCSICGDSYTESIEKTHVDFEKIYSELYLEEPWATLGRDNSYLMIDTNPNNTDYEDLSGDEIAMWLSAIDKIKEVHEYLGLPDYLYEDMERTTALQGKQSQKYEEIGIEVTWSYHPDNGLNVQYRLL